MCISKIVKGVRSQESGVRKKKEEGVRFVHETLRSIFFTHF
ncbi:hypothetical protein [Dolichospermum sp. UHCC 0259]|nr:hypothetical protein [Dolichospermum sp. UHCC 0259]